MTRELPSFPAPRSAHCSPRGWSGAGYSPSCVRVIKPFIGGGFGNKQDVLEEPMAAFLTSKLGGIPVKVSLAVKSVSSQPVPATLYY